MGLTDLALFGRISEFKIATFGLLGIDPHGLAAQQHHSVAHQFSSAQINPVHSIVMQQSAQVSKNVSRKTTYPPRRVPEKRDGINITSSPLFIFPLFRCQPALMQQYTSICNITALTPLYSSSPSVPSSGRCHATVYATSRRQPSFSATTINAGDAAAAPIGRDA